MPNAPNLREKIMKPVLTVLPGAKRDSHRLPEGRAPGMAHVHRSGWLRLRNISPFSRPSPAP